MTRVYDAVAGRSVEVFESSIETSMHASADQLVFVAASELAFRLTEDEKGVEAVVLTVKMYRSEVFKLTKANDNVSIEPMELAKLPPMILMTLVFDGDARLVEGATRNFASGTSFEDLATSRDEKGSSVFFDFQNYEYRGFHQAKPADEGSTETIH